MFTLLYKQTKKCPILLLKLVYYIIFFFNLLAFNTNLRLFGHYLVGYIKKVTAA
jgi:hypothetical protein